MTIRAGLSREEAILQILAELQRLVRDSRAGFKAVAGEHGLTYYQGSTLVLIHRRGGVLNMSEISDALHMSPSTVTSIVYALLSRGLLDRGPAIDDRRSVVATLTTTGIATAESIIATETRHLPTGSMRVSNEDIGPFLDVLTVAGGREREYRLIGRRFRWWFPGAGDATGQDFGNMPGRAVGKVLDLLATGDTSHGDHGFLGRCIYGREEAFFADLLRDLVVLFLVPERSRHATAARS